MVYDRIIRLQLAEDKPHKLSAWMIAYHLGQGGIVATFGSWKGQPEKVVWSSITEHTMTAQERLDYKARIAQASEKHEQETQRLRVEAAKEAAEIVAKAEPVPANFPYLARKGLPVPKGCYLHEGKLAVPVLSEVGIHGFEFIHHDGTKRSLVGTDKKGHWFCFPGAPERVLIAEGWATGASLNAATGATVYTTFGAGNLYDVASWAVRKHPNAAVMICGDLGEAGESKARQAAEGLGIEVVFPPEGLAEGGKDFNDMHVQMGLEAVKSVFGTKVAVRTQKPLEAVALKPLKSMDDVPYPETGFLRDVFNYYNATSMNERRGFASQTALALGSMILGRRYVTDNENYSSLYLLNVGVTGIGKEHAKKVIGNILKSVNKIKQFIGGGYTSEGAVITALYNHPKHICVWDEFGRHMQAGKFGKDANSTTAISKLMMAIGSCDSFVNSKVYSAAGLDKKKQKDQESKVIYKPAVSLLAMTTPSTFFDGAGSGMVSDGFAGRFITYFSKDKRDIRRKVGSLPVPETIKNWIEVIDRRSGADIKPDFPEEDPVPVVVSIPKDVYDYYTDNCERFFLDWQEDLERKGKGLEDLVNRSSEMALRLALISALSRDPWTESVSMQDMVWAIRYVIYCAQGAVKNFQRTMFSSEFEGDKLDALEAFRKAGSRGITNSEMNKKLPFSKWKARDRRDILEALKEAELIEVKIESGTGRPKTVYTINEGGEE